MMTREKAKKLMHELGNLIINILDKYLDDIYMVIVKYLEDKITEKKAIKELDNLFRQALEEVYKKTSQIIKENYKRTSPFNVTNILDLTYHADGKTLKQRLENYLKLDLTRIKLFEKTYRLLLNESKIVESLVIKGKLSKVAYILVIECDENDCEFGCSDYAGEYPADEGIPLPPYHPDCVCEYYYIETDDEDDIHDLDLEIEEIRHSTKEE